MGSKVIKLETKFGLRFKGVSKIGHTGHLTQLQRFLDLNWRAPHWYLLGAFLNALLEICLDAVILRYATA